MKRFSILGLMGLVVAVAVAIAALRYAGEVWAGLLLMALLGLLGASILGVAYARGPGRAGWLGFLVFGGGYAALAFAPGLSDSLAPRLPTSRLLRLAHDRVAIPAIRLNVVTIGVAGSPSGPIVPNPGSTMPPTPAPMPTPTPTTTELAFAVRANSVAQISGNNVVVWDADPQDDPGAFRWRSLLPGAANLEDFSRVGHGLFGLLAGLLGAAIARRFEARGGEHDTGEDAGRAGALPT